jgi:catechol 2,3-dioxygenase-like lactoylglutathione lyase family enzyme
MSKHDDKVALITTGDAPAAMRGIDHACVRVDDFERAIAWYGEKLGFSVEKRWRIEQLPGVEVAYLKGSNGFRVEITGGGDGRRHSAGWNFMEYFSLRGWNHICFSSEDVDATMADLASRGVPAFLPAFDYLEGVSARYAFIQDSEGNMIEFRGPLSSPNDIVS